MINEMKRGFSMKLKIGDMGMGLVYAHNDDVVLMGGFRSGNSPANETRRKYLIFDKKRWDELEKQGQLNSNEIQKATEVGFVDFFVRDGQELTLGITGLVNIEIKKEYRKSGMARKVIDSIRQHTGEQLVIHDIKKHYASFWRKVGVTSFHNGNGLEVKVSQYAGFIAGTMPPIDQMPEKNLDGKHSGFDSQEMSM